MQGISSFSTKLLIQTAKICREIFALPIAIQFVNETKVTLSEDELQTQRAKIMRNSVRPSENGARQVRYVAIQLRLERLRETSGGDGLGVV